MGSSKKSSHVPKESGEIVLLSEQVVVPHFLTGIDSESLMKTLVCVIESWLREPFQNSQIVTLSLLGGKSKAIALGVPEETVNEVILKLAQFYEGKTEHMRGFMG